MMTRIKTITKDEAGAPALEYVILVALIALAILVGAAALGTAINGKYDSTADNVEIFGAPAAPEAG